MMCVTGPPSPGVGLALSPIGGVLVPGVSDDAPTPPEGKWLLN